MAFLDNWHPIQKAGNDTLCADLIISNGFTIRIEAIDNNDLEASTIVDMLIFDSIGWNIHNSQLSKVDASILGLEFIEQYRDALYYKNVPKNLVLNVINVLNGKSTNNDAVVAVVTKRQEKHCYRCNRMCDIGDKECWWCTASNPTEDIK
jgi:hypothetical protein